MEIVPHVHLIPGVIANPYLLIDGEAITLIDTGLPWSKNKIIAYIHDLGYSTHQIKNIIITHTDLDHIGGLAALRRASGARILTSAIEAQALAEGHPSRPIPARNRRRGFLLRLMVKLAKSPRITADEIVTGGQVLPILGGLRVIDSAGHTPGHISLYLPSAGVLFSGDSIISEGDKLLPSREAVTWDRQKADESVRLQASLGAHIVCPGHGPVIMDAAGKFPPV